MPEIFFLSGLTEHSYCQYETFEATCPDNEVIIMRVARYGRIVIGPCVNADFGFLGCYSDVTKLMDRKCSGRKSCQVLVVDPTFGNIQPCNMEFKNYLEASYDCLQGENPTTSVTKWASTWWRHQMETFSALLAICAGNSPVPGDFPAQRPVTRSFDVFFDLRLNKRLSKQSWGWWSETISRPLWRYRNEVNG